MSTPSPNIISLRFPQTSIIDRAGNLSLEWQQWFLYLQNTLVALATGNQQIISLASGSSGVQSIDGVDGADGFSIPGPAGPQGQTGAIGLAMDGIDGQDGFPIQGPKGDAGAAGIPGMDGIDATPEWLILGPAVDVSGGAYTPSLTDVANLDSSTAYECQYAKVGSTITVSGRVDLDPTTAGVSTQLGISLPFPSAFANSEDCAGVAFCPTVSGEGAAILADTTHDRAQLEYIAGDATEQPFYFTFTYQVV